MFEKDAEESSKKAFCIAHSHEDELIYRNGFQQGAEPREKQIQIDAEQIRALQKQNGELTDKVRELEAQIEKMKCCEICMYKGFGRNFEFRCSIQGHIIKNPFEEKCDKWEIEK